MKQVLFLEGRTFDGAPTQRVCLGESKAQNEEERYIQTFIITNKPINRHMYIQRGLVLPCGVSSLDVRCTGHLGRERDLVRCGQHRGSETTPWHKARDTNRLFTDTLNPGERESTVQYSTAPTHNRTDLCPDCRRGRGCGLGDDRRRHRERRAGAWGGSEER
jgi:hypothetical protein